MTTLAEKRKRYIPTNADLQDVGSLNAELYFYHDSKNRPCSVGFHGRAQKPSIHFHHNDEDQRETTTNRWLKRIEEQQSRMEENRKQRFEPHTLKVDDVLVCSWGWEQTNVDFYKVTKSVGKNTVELVRIKAVSDPNGQEARFSMQDRAIADPKTEIGAPFRARVNMGSGSPCITLGHREFAYPWDGKATHRSWYA